LSKQLVSLLQEKIAADQQVKAQNIVKSCRRTSRASRFQHAAGKPGDFFKGGGVTPTPSSPSSACGPPQA
jgi:hypothetical protein